MSIGIGQWSRLETDRVDGGVLDGATVKTQGLLSRCISYTLTTEILSLGLSLNEQPQVIIGLEEKIKQIIISPIHFNSTSMSELLQSITNNIIMLQE